MPVPDDMPSWLPPAEKMIGTMLAMPKPQNAKAAMASQGEGDRPATSMPAAATSAETRSVVTAPKRLRTPSPKKRMTAMTPEKAA